MEATKGSWKNAGQMSLWLICLKEKQMTQTN